MKTILIILLMLPIWLQAQTTFVKTYSTPVNDVGKRIYEVNDTTYILQCKSRNWGTSDSDEGLYYIINAGGVIKGMKKFPFYIDNFFPNTDGTMTFNGHTFDGNLIIGSISNHLNVDTVIEIDMPGNERYECAGSKMMQDSSIVLVTRKLWGWDANIVLVKHNKFDTIDTRSFDLYSSGSCDNGVYVTSIDLLGDSILYVTGSCGFLLKTNSNLDSISFFGNYQYQTSSGLCYKTNIQNDTLIALSREIFQNGYVFSEFDLDLNLLTTKDTSFMPDWYADYKDFEIIDDAIYMAGFRYKAYDTLEEQISIAKLDLNYDTIWTKQFGGIYEDNVHDIILTKDSCLMIIGELKIGPTPNDVDVIVIKMDLNGQIIGGTGFIPERKVMVNVYPNPVSEALTLSFVNNNNLTSLHFQLYDLSGKLIIDESLKDSQKNYHINLSKVTSGTYLYRLADDQGAFYSKKIVIQ